MLEETRYDGKVVVDNAGLIAHSKITIDGHSFTMDLRDGGSGHLHSKLQINETADPKRITFDWYGGQARGVYTLDGDTFLFCYEPGAKEPPAKVGAPAGSKNRAPRLQAASRARTTRASRPTRPRRSRSRGTPRPSPPRCSPPTARRWSPPTRTGWSRSGTSGPGRSGPPSRRRAGSCCRPTGRVATVEADRARERSVRLWDTATGRPVGDPVPGGATALSGRADTGSLRRLELRPLGRARGPRRATLAAEIDTTRNRIADGKQFTDLTFSPDGKTAATTTADRTVVVWEVPSAKPEGFVATGKKLTTIAGHAVAWPIYPQKARNESRVPPVLTAAEQKQLAAAVAAANFRLAYAPDGRTLATARGGEVRLWDVRTGRELGKFLAPHRPDVTHLGFPPTERR